MIKKSLTTYKGKFGADAPTYDASQGDGGASLPGVPHELLDRANELQKKQGTGYDQPYGADVFRKATAEQYWKFDAATGYGPQNITAAEGGRDALLKAYQAMTMFGTGRIGDALIVSRVPWISYKWGPYSIGMNVLLAPGEEAHAWEYTEDGIAAAIEYAKACGGRKVTGLIITSPDNPTGNTLPMARQIALARKALELGIPYVLFDWIYHQITTGATANINEVLNAFEPAQRERLMFLDGLTKSLGASNLRGAHLIASKKVIDYIVSIASHAVIPNFYAQAVAIAAYEKGYATAARSIIEPTNASREVMRKFLKEHNYRAIIGEGGYYAFIDCAPAIQRLGLADSIQFGQHLAENFGVAVIPGSFFSDAGKNWIRFSYALPPEKTKKAVIRFDEGFKA
ncbi:MAG TPA: pyridoxal phosphate-dependent aminotransferase [Aggregatilineales bacterium]|nr:pyridoxal phosphate-dependent aminotransferase [Aggregatilineales bacterium]